MLDTIFDPLRKREVARTPEEEVRQKTILWLNKRGFSLNLMSSEYSFVYNGMKYRADIVVFNRLGRPEVLVECKAPSVELTHDVLSQGLRYNKVLQVKYLMFTNGKRISLYKKDDNASNYSPVTDF